MDNFIKQVRSKCSCKKQCIVSIPTFKSSTLYNTLQTNENNNICKIKTGGNPLDILTDAIDLGLIYKSSLHKYHLFNENEMNWHNIQSISIDDIIQLYTRNKRTLNLLLFYLSGAGSNSDTKIMKDVVLIYFWYMRKLIIDSVLYSDDILAISVGSTDITSDYDITLYGSREEMYNTLHSFNKIFYNIFKQDSGIIFDTNIYTISFITMQENTRLGRRDSLTSISDTYYNTPLTCPPYNILILQDTPNARFTQHIWAFVKILDSLNRFTSHLPHYYDYFRRKISTYYPQYYTLANKL